MAESFIVTVDRFSKVEYLSGLSTGAQLGGAMAIGILGKAQRLTQEQIVLGLSLALFLGFGIFVSGFLAADNVLSLVQNVAILSAH